MSITYLKHFEIDKDKWDICISNAYNGMIYAYSWYLDIVSENWDALIEDDYKTVFPLTHRAKFGINYLYPPFFTQQLGIFSLNIITEQKLIEFIEAIPSKFNFIEIYLNKNNTINNDFYKLIPNTSFEVDLCNSYESLYKDFATNTKRNIKKAIKKGLSIQETNSFEDIIELFRNNRGKDIKTLTNSDFDNLKLLMNELIKRNMVEIWTAYNAKGELCAGVFFATSNQKTIFLFSGRNQEAKDNGAISFLINHFIEQNAGEKQILDFAGSNDENLARFYRSFGAKKYSYFLLKINRLPWYLKLLKK